MDLDQARTEAEDAYELLFAVFRWELDRVLKQAEQLAAKHGAEKARRFLLAQATHIRSQAYR